MNKKDAKWLKLVKDNPYKYVIMIDNDVIYVQTVEEEPKHMYDFEEYGYYFIYALLKQMNYNVYYV